MSLSYYPPQHIRNFPSPPSFPSSPSLSSLSKSTPLLLFPPRPVTLNPLTCRHLWRRRISSASFDIGHSNATQDVGGLSRNVLSTSGLLQVTTALFLLDGCRPKRSKSARRTRGFWWIWSPRLTSPPLAARLLFSFSFGRLSKKHNYPHPLGLLSRPLSTSRCIRSLSPLFLPPRFPCSRSSRKRQPSIAATPLVRWALCKSDQLASIRFSFLWFLGYAPVTRVVWISDCDPLYDNDGPRGMLGRLHRRPSPVGAMGAQEFNRCVNHFFRHFFYHT